MPSKIISKCEICNRKFKHQTYFKRHIEKCKTELKQMPKEYICKVCGKKFSSPSAIGGHMGLVHGEKNMNKKEHFECEICGEKMYTNKGAFINHIKLHDEEFAKQKSKNISDAKLKFYADEERSKETREFMSDFMKEKNPMFEKENIDKMKQSRKEYFENLTDEEYSKLVINFINAPKKGNAVNHSGKYTPTRIEQIVMDFNIDGLEYNGNKEDSKTIRFENKNFKHSLTPDFIYKNKNIFVETFGVYWHPKEDEIIYRNACKENDCKIFIIWEDELLLKPTNVKKRLLNFLSQFNNI